MTTTVEVDFETEANSVAFTLDISVLDGTTPFLDAAWPNPWTDISGQVRSVSVRRGRSRSLDEIDSGHASVEVMGYDRVLDPFNGPTAFVSTADGDKVTSTVPASIGYTDSTAVIDAPLDLRWCGRITTLPTGGDIATLVQFDDAGGNPVGRLSIDASKRLLWRQWNSTKEILVTGTAISAITAGGLFAFRMRRDTGIAPQVVINFAWKKISAELTAVREARTHSGWTTAATGTYTNVTDAIAATGVQVGTPMKAATAVRIADTGTSTQRLIGETLLVCAGPFRGSATTGGGMHLEMHPGDAVEGSDSSWTGRTDGLTWTRTGGSITHGSPLYGLLTPGRPMRVCVDGEPVFTGYSNDWSMGYRVDLTSAGNLSAGDALSLIARRQMGALSVIAGTGTGANILAARTHLGDLPPINADTGIGTVQAHTVAVGVNALTYFQQIARTEAGQFYADRRGALTFRQRSDVFTATAAVLAFSDDGTPGTVAFHDASMFAQTETLHTKVSVTRNGGSRNSATATAAAAMWGVRELSLDGLLHETEQQSSDMAAVFAAIYSRLDSRVGRLSVKVHGISDATLRATLLTLDIGDVVSVTWTPLGRDATTSRLCPVEGIEHSINYAGEHVVTLSLGDLDLLNGLDLTDAVVRRFLGLP